MSKESKSIEDVSNEFDSRRSSRRSLASSSSKSQQQTALEKLKQARATGKYRARVDDLVQDVYVEVDDEEYQTQKQNYREFVEDDDGAGYYDDDSEEDEFDDERSSRRKKKEDKRAKAKEGTIKHHFQVVTNKQKQTDKPVRVDDDDILKQCLADIVGTSNFEAEDQVQSPAYEDPFTSSFTIPSDSQRLAPHSPEFFDSYENEFESPIANAKPHDKQTEAKNKTRMTSIPSNPLIMLDDLEPSVHPHSEQPELAIIEEKPSPSPPPASASMQTPESQQRKRGASPMDCISFSQRPAKVARNINEQSDETKNLLKFYFLDAFENIYKQPGTVYLFGYAKTDDGQFESCCLVLKNVAKQLLFIKRDFSQSTKKPILLEDMIREVKRTLQTKCGISKFKCEQKLVERRFISANESVPKEAEALEVWLTCKYGQIPADLSGDCFSHVMNTTTTALERVLVERDIYGPCWLEIEHLERVDCPVSHCPVEYVVNMDQMDAVRMLKNSAAEPTPPITLISINVLTALNQETKENQIVMASLIHHTCSLDKPTFDAKNLSKNRFCVLSKFKKGLSLPFDLDDQLRKQGIASLVQKVGDELALLNIFLAKLERLNPDLIMAHDLSAQMALLHSRMEKHKLKKWDRLGRLKRSLPLQKVGGHGATKSSQWELTAGRLCLDSKTTASELMHMRSYELEDLVPNYLKLTRQNLSIEQISDTFQSTNPKIKLVDLIRWNWNEGWYTMRIVEKLNAIPLFVQITQIVGGVLSRTLMGGRAERNEFLLLHACHKNNYTAPDKQQWGNATRWQTGTKPVADKKAKPKKQLKTGGTVRLEQEVMALELDEPEPAEVEVEAEEEDGANAVGQQTENGGGKKVGKNNKKTQYTGGLVLEPKKGLYETFILLLDFNSLYPSIIQEYNICFTTVDRAFADLSEEDLPIPPGSSRPDGILKNEIRKLVNKRREVKNLMNKEKPGSDKYQQYNIRQMGLKLTANSMYGCLGFQNSRFYAKTLAAMITSKGRELLIHTKSLVENERFTVIYGDTDSIMVDTNTTDFAQAKLMGYKLKQIVNKNYSLLELDLDGIYKRLLLLKKKKYAALVVDINDENSVTEELKGLDVVRRDWSELAKDIGKEIVSLILSPIDRSTLVERIKATLAERRVDLDEGRFPLDKFEILKQLTRDPADYKEQHKAMPHVGIAQRLNATMQFRLRQGDIVKYVICTDGTNNPPTQRGYHASEILANEELHVDKNYYLAQQIHPVVTRLLEPIEELDAYKVAEILGLDPSAYHRRATAVGGGSYASVLIDLSVVFAPLMVHKR